MLTLQTDSSPERERDDWLEGHGASARAVIRSDDDDEIKDGKMKKTTSAWADMFTHLNAVGEVWFSSGAAFDQTEVRQNNKPVNTAENAATTEGETDLSCRSRRRSQEVKNKDMKR